MNSFSFPNKSNNPEEHKELEAKKHCSASEGTIKFQNKLETLLKAEQIIEPKSEPLHDEDLVPISTKFNTKVKFEENELNYGKRLNDFERENFKYFICPYYKNEIKREVTEKPEEEFDRKELSIIDVDVDILENMKTKQSNEDFREFSYKIENIGNHFENCDDFNTNIGKKQERDSELKHKESIIFDNELKTESSSQINESQPKDFVTDILDNDDGNSDIHIHNKQNFHGYIVNEEGDNRTSTNSIKKVENTKNLQCSQCSYIARQKNHLKSHMIHHMKSNDVDVFQCNRCSYIAIKKRSIKKHMKVHMKQDDIECFQCSKCSYQSNYKIGLVNHMKVHVKSRDLSVFKCNKCSYSTKQNFILNRHMKIHMKPEDIDMFQCNHCSYKARRKDYLTNHMKNHMNPEDIEMFYCANCSYRTKKKSDLKYHMKNHMNPEDIETFQCNHCSYRAKRRHHLREHIKIHMKPEDIEMFECVLCSLKTKRKGNLKKHMKTHMKSEDL